jgi:beta-fructofuranosidase
MSITNPKTPATFRAAILFTLCCFASLRPAMVCGSEPIEIRDKTLVAWLTPLHLEQRGVSVLTLENPPSEFDAIVLGEITPGKWMAGSDYFHRTQRDQGERIAETETNRLIQIAIVYKGRDVQMFRDGKRYARFMMPNEPATFTAKSHVLLGLHHMDVVGASCFVGSIEDARIYDTALDATSIAELKPDVPSRIEPLAWWDFEDDKGKDRMETFPRGRLFGNARILDGRLQLRGGFMTVGVHALDGITRETEAWPTYHLTALPEEGLCRPYDANGCIHWNGRYHLMYIFQDRQRPRDGHSWGHASSSDLVNWTFHAPALVPGPNDPDRGIFSGNAFINKDGVPMLCWFGIDAGVCVATAADDGLIQWDKHPANPIIPIPGAGEPNHGLYNVWDPYLWLEGDTYYCLLGGNKLADGEDTLYLLKSPDLVQWTPLHPFYEANPAWTVAGEDCSCPDFFRLGDKHVLLSISHSVGSRCYVGRFEDERFHPEQHIRMNWPGANFFAPESLQAPDGRRIFWGWVTDPRLISSQVATGSGFQSLPRVLSLSGDDQIEIKPAVELESLRRGHHEFTDITLPDGRDITLDDVAGDTLELYVEIDPNGAGRSNQVNAGGAREVGVKIRCSPDGQEETIIMYDPVSNLLKLDVSHSTLRDDVVYRFHPLDTGALWDLRNGAAHRRSVVEAPLTLDATEPLRLRIFLDKAMLEVFANDRQCITQQIYPSRADSLLVKAFSLGGEARINTVNAWAMAPAQFVNDKSTGEKQE